jgi:type IV secretion system protein VirD4
MGSSRSLRPTSDPLARALGLARAAGSGIYVGRGSVGPVFTAPEQALLVLGPPRSGKSSAVVVPNLLSWNGPAIVASTKGDLLAVASAARRRLGPVWLYDPSETVAAPRGVETVGWSPVTSAVSFEGALLMADTMVGAARPGQERGEGAHWSERARSLIATLLHGAAVDGSSMREVLITVNRRDPTRLRAALARADAELASDVLTGILTTDEREQSGIWSTASSVLGGFVSAPALRSTERSPIDMEKLTKGCGTLFICASSERQHHAGPMVAGLIRDVRTAVYDAHFAALSDRDAAAVRSDTPRQLLAVLDELANIAPLHDLPALVAEGGSQGISVLACLQDLSQARARWGVEADGFLSLFGTKLLLAGIGDRATLEAVSLLAGEMSITSETTTRPARKMTLRRITPERRTSSTTTGTIRVRRLPPDRIAQGLPGCAVGIDGAAVAFIELTPWYGDPMFRSAAVSATDSRLERAPRAARRHHEASRRWGSGRYLER